MWNFIVTIPIPSLLILNFLGILKWQFCSYWPTFLESTQYGLLDNTILLYFFQSAHNGQERPFAQIVIAERSNTMIACLMENLTDLVTVSQREMVVTCALVEITVKLTVHRKNVVCIVSSGSRSWIQMLRTLTEALTTESRRRVAY